jgi:hypothetical protein
VSLLDYDIWWWTTCITLEPFLCLCRSHGQLMGDLRRSRKTCTSLRALTWPITPQTRLGATPPLTCGLQMALALATSC